MAGSLDRPSAARVYDYFLGGTMNYAIDRAFAQQVRRRVPLLGHYMRASRQFLGRAVRHCARLGMTQFVDLGSGLPTVGNVHDVADRARPEQDTRVVYVDNEPVVLAHSQLLLADTADPERHKAIAADFMRPADVWGRVDDAGVIDLDLPIVLVVNAVLHFVKDAEGPNEIMAHYRSLLPAGSLLVLSQMTGENPRDEQERQALADLVEYYERTSNPGQLRSTAEFARFFGNWDLLEPGLVYVPAWHPDEETVFADDPSKSRVIG